MHDLPFEGVQAFDIGIPGLVELADGGDEEVGFDGVAGVELGVFAACDVDVDGPC